MEAGILIDWSAFNRCACFAMLELIRWFEFDGIMLRGYMLEYGLGRL